LKFESKFKDRTFGTVTYCRFKESVSVLRIPQIFGLSLRILHRNCLIG